MTEISAPLSLVNRLIEECHVNHGTYFMINKTVEKSPSNQDRDAGSSHGALSLLGV
jgi:hypothetical protein